MKKASLSLFFMIMCLANFAQESSDAIVDDRDIWTRIGDIIFTSLPLGNGISMPFVIIWLLVGAIIFTIYMGFINIRGFKHALDVVRGKYDDPNDPGEVSHFPSTYRSTFRNRWSGQYCRCGHCRIIGWSRCHLLDDPCRIFRECLPSLLSVLWV